MSDFTRPYVVSWNLTYRCNLACEHCYLDAGGTPQVDTENFADRSELGTEDCFRVIDEIAAFAPECVTILTGGEPPPVRWTDAAEARLANIPAFVRPMARTGIERYARERGTLEVDETILDAAKDFFGM